MSRVKRARSPFRQDFTLPPALTPAGWLLLLLVAAVGCLAGAAVALLLDAHGAGNRTAALPVGLLMFGGVFALLRRPTRVALGLDGVAITRIGGRRLVTYAAIATIESSERPVAGRAGPPLFTLRIQTRHDGAVELCHRFSRDIAALRTAIETRLTSAPLGEWPAALPDATTEAAAAVTQALRLRSERGHYRSSLISTEALWKLLLVPGQPTHRRVIAAIALGPADPERQAVVTSAILSRAERRDVAKAFVLQRADDLVRLVNRTRRAASRNG